MRCDRCHDITELEHISLAKLNSHCQAESALIACLVVDVCEECVTELSEQWNALVDCFLQSCTHIKMSRRGDTGGCDE